MSPKNAAEYICSFFYNFDWILDFTFVKTI